MTTEPFAAGWTQGSAPSGGGALRALAVVWRREILRFSRNRLRIVTQLAQPALFLFVLGTGLGSVAGGDGSGAFRTFMFPGILAMIVLFTALFSAISIVWDREFGFLREMLVAPVRREAIVLGKCAGGATTAVLQGLLMLALAGLAGVPYSPPLLITLVAEMCLVAFALTSLGVLVASRMRQVESFQAVVQFLVMPMFFLSGAVFPPNRLPAWLSVLTRLDPLAYAVDPMRRAVFDHLRVSATLRAQYDSGISWAGWRVPVAIELGVITLLAIAALIGAAAQFRRID